MLMDKRKTELMALVNDSTYEPLIDEMLYLEEELDRLRRLPKIKIHPGDISIQKLTPAAKLYKDYLQQYVNVVKVLMRITGADEEDEESPLRKWVNEHMDT